MAQATLVSLAILKVNWDVFGKDYVENFVPFVAEAVRLSTAAAVSLPELQQSVVDTFGLRIPQHSLKTILVRVAKRKYLHRDAGVFRPNRPELDKLNFQETQQRALMHHRTVVQQLISFCAANYSVDWSVEDAEVALLDYLAGC